MSGSLVSADDLRWTSRRTTSQAAIAIQALPREIVTATTIFTHNLSHGLFVLDVVDLPVVDDDDVAVGADNVPVAGAYG